MINAKTQLYCILGKPVSHSLSPAMHNAAYAHAGINAVYLAFESSSICSALEAVKSLGIKGASVTIPHKIEVMKHLDIIDPLAEKIGSVNTIVNREGLIQGYNTDGYGALKALEAGGYIPARSKALVIGNGGSARAIAFTLLDAGSNVFITGRNISNIESLRDDLKRFYGSTETVNLNDLTKKLMSKFDAVINTTPLGMTPDTDSSPLPGNLFSSDSLAFDIVYNPDETRFLREAAAAGCRTVKGIEMLLHQGAEQFRIWFGIEPPVEVMRDALGAARQAAL